MLPRDQHIPQAGSWLHMSAQQPACRRSLALSHPGGTARRDGSFEERRSTPPGQASPPRHPQRRRERISLDRPAAQGLHQCRLSGKTAMIDRGGLVPLADPATLQKQTFPPKWRRTAGQAPHAHTSPRAQSFYSKLPSRATTHGALAERLFVSSSKLSHIKCISTRPGKTTFFP